MSLTGYRCKDELRDLAEDIDGYSITFLKKLAVKRNCYIEFEFFLYYRDCQMRIYSTANEQIKGCIIIFRPCMDA